MSIKLFEVESGVVKPTEHCFVIEPLRVIMELYPDNYMDRYAYIQYMTCLDEKDNPYLNTKEEDKEDIILASLKSNFSPEDEGMGEAVEFCNTLFETPTKRAWKGLKIMSDQISDFLATEKITTGKDGNAVAINAMIRSRKDIREETKIAYKELQEEQGSTRIRGDKKKAYDQ